MVRKTRRKDWTFSFLSFFVCLTTSLSFVEAQDPSNCLHPEVPFAAKYVNVTGGPDQVILFR